MKRITKRQVIRIFLFLIIALLCVFYLRKKITYTSYESDVSGKVNSSIAKWNISINENDITSSDVTKIDIDSISWNTNNVRSGKVAPGSTGVITLVVDPLDTNVAIKYTLELIDKTIDDNKILTVTGVNNDVDLLSRTFSKKSSDSYTGIINLDDRNRRTITINVEWINDDLENDLDREILSNDDFIEIYFKANQYKNN